MKTIRKTNALIIALSIIFTTFSYGQKFDNALSYMEFISKEYRKITEDMWDYTSAAAHSKSARKIENRRRDLLNTTRKAQQNIAKMPDFEGDKALRDSTVSYLELSFDVLNNDYAKIVNLEEVAEQSYDQMEAYILAQEIANEKLDQAGQRMDLEHQEFANKHNIKLIDEKDKLGRKLEKANKAFKYYNVVYLIFFKSFKQDFYLANALQKNDVNAIEQNRNSLLKFAEDGLKKLDTLKAFGGDNSLKISLKQLLDFYKTKTSVKIPVVVSFYLKKEKFEKTKTEFDAKSEFERTKTDVDQYNKTLAEYNKGVTDYNRVSAEILQQNNIRIDAWDKTVQSFLDRQVPKK